MATNSDRFPSSSIATTSYETALCIIPPRHQCQDIDRLRSLYDKGYGKWPPHINLIYPFVAPESLPRAKLLIESHLHNAPGRKIDATLDQAGWFEHKTNSTVFLRAGEIAGDGPFSTLRTQALRALGQTASACNFHLTVGQSEDTTDSSRSFLMNKAQLLPAIKFGFESLAILIRERTSTGEAVGGMRLWGVISFHSAQVIKPLFVEEYWLQTSQFDATPAESDNEEGIPSGIIPTSSFSHQIQAGTTYLFDHELGRWSPKISSTKVGSNSATLSVSSYNVLIDSKHPPNGDRGLLLVKAILDDSARADVLFMQEASDEFLSFLLADEDVRQQYPYASHGPPSQADIGPLPSLRNMVVLSKRHFDWQYVPFHRRHKGAIVALFPSSSQSSPLFVAVGVHLTCGLTDGSVAAKKIQVQTLTNHLKRTYPDSPWIIAGDFNITTSKYTIDQAVSNKSISQHTARTLESIEVLFNEASLFDAWSMSRLQDVDKSTAQASDDLYDGEEGATFNPRENSLAAATSGTSNSRPQRYDRVLFRPQNLFDINKFDCFGLPESDAENITHVASDHSGIRATFNVQANTVASSNETLDVLQRYPVEHAIAAEALSQAANLTQTLDKHSVLPSDDEKARRASAFALIKRVVLGTSDENAASSDVPMVIVPVGSYALGVWTMASDIDCLCVGPISSKTFFQLVRQRVYRAESQGVRFLRRVVANTGTMLELSYDNINIDLQYCPAASVVQRWAEIPTLHPSDPIFNLPVLSLRKLKPVRDLTYMQRTLPSMKSFRLAYYFIKLWAVEHGIYSAKFGYLGGTHITLMLSWVCKRLAHEISSVSAPDLIVSFFHHYANFDWQNDMVFDAFFHKKRPRYQRTTREPMVILGHHTPNSNTAHTATVPGLQVMVKEFQRATERLSSSQITWSTIFDKRAHIDATIPAAAGMENFLVSCGSYVKIDIQYWGRALSKGKGLIGWVESRCINLVVDMHKALPHLFIRIWPARFANANTDDANAYYSGCYLIGLSRNEDSVYPSAKGERSDSKAALQKTFDRFLDQVRADTKHYDASSCWIDISLAKPNAVGGLSLDEREWGDYIADTEDDSDDEENVDDSQDESANPGRARKLPIRPVASSTSIPVSSSKLRPASDILHRLRWDSNLEPSDYIVGYEDRFLGAKETSLERWKTEQTDEEFIPQHRILYFKKRGKSSGEVVWERATRIDKIFGSGAGDGLST